LGCFVGYSYACLRDARYSESCYGYAFVLYSMSTPEAPEQF